MQPFVAPAVLGTALFSAMTGATVSHSINNDISYQVGVPEASANAGSGNIYLQLRASTSYEWVALGTGSRMSGANIFVMYTNGNGNVTVSARKGTGHVMPEHQTDTQVTLLAGSGVNGSTMLANVQCANCEDWSGGSLSLTSSSSDFIAAYRKGSPLDSSDPAESISIHDEKYQFNLDLTKATISSDTNPFTGAGATDNAVPSGGDSDSDSSESGGMSTRSIQAAHGVVMAVAMILLYPIGALLMPTLGNWLIHAIWQMIAFAAMWAGFALGVVLAERTGIRFSASHTILGTVVVVLLGVQPILGYLHHLSFVKTQKRGAISHAHIWYGRILLVLGTVNGGLGIRLAGAGQGLVTGYSVVAGVVYAAYIGSAIWGVVRRKRSNTTPNSPRKERM